ncbi:NYN domain-containing protein [Tundrisphaera lichenicola]|uniref:NYN domain-containing protein n=1 Tax=Tundrisphaera lichenicola TaxID=2029860 RepID=UPI003EB7D4D9
MRTLIDGYNLMYAGGLLGPRLGPDRFRKVRNRFLNDLASWLDPVEAHLTTVVFDAVEAPLNLPQATRHKGLAVLYAIENESADERIEELISQHNSPKSLTVVSSDHRIQKAASRKRAKVLSADDYWVRLDQLKGTRRLATKPEKPIRAEIPSAEEAEFWLEEFRDLVESEEVREAFKGDPAFPTDEELARIAREVEDEFLGR